MSKRILLPVVGLMLTLILCVPTQSDAQTTPDQRLGMTEVFWLPEEAQDLGVGWERILFYWREIQPEGPDDWNTLHVMEEWLVEADRQGREVVGLVKNTAPWASVDGSEAGLPKGLDLPVDDPDNLWANYVRRLADYYGPLGVHHWIIWNEPEIARGVYGFEFAGSAADYYQMLKIAYMVMKQRDPQAVIHLAGLTWWHDPTFLDRLLAIAAADPKGAENGYYFDVISLHIYFRTETVRSIIEEVREIQGRYGLDKPIWINETNAPPNRDPEWPVNRPRFNIDLDQQAWFIVQGLALGFGSGAERISVYKLVDIHLPPGGESFGLVRPDQSRRPAYDAYKMATRCFGAFDGIVMAEDPLYYHVTFSRPGVQTHVAWARTPAAAVVEIGASAEFGTVLDLSGATSEVLPEGGLYSLQLAGQRCDQECLVGGEPLLLVETGGDAGDADACLNFKTAAFDTPTRITENDETVGTPTSVAPETIPAAESRTPEVLDEPEVEKPAPASEIDDATPTGTDPVAAASATRLSGEDAPITMSDSSEVSAKNGEQVAERDNDNSAVGLWFIGLGAVLGLVLTLFVLRTRNDRKA